MPAPDRLLRAKPGKEAPPNPWRSHLPVVLLLITGVFLSFLVSRALGVESLRASRRAFSNWCDAHARTLQATIDEDLNVLRFLNEFYAASNLVERDEFRQFIRHHLSVEPSVLALEWVPRVRDAERGAYEELARKEGLSGFTFTEWNAQDEIVEAAQHPEYYPVYFVEPLQGNESALGFDLAADPHRWAALEQARDTGELAATPCLQLIQSSAQKDPFASYCGVIAVLPVYQRGTAPTTVEERRRDLNGFMVGVFMPPAWIRDSLTYQGIRGARLHVYDLAEEAAGLDYEIQAVIGKEGLWNILFVPAPNTSTDMGTFGYRTFFGIGARRWHLDYIPMGLRSEEEPYIRRGLHWVALLIGLALTLLAAVYLFSVIRYTARMAALASNLSTANRRLESILLERMQAQEALKESEERFRQMSAAAPDAVVLMDSKGRIAYWNLAAEKMFGYGANDAIGKDLHAILLPQHYRAAAGEALSRFWKTGSGPIVGTVRELSALRKDGSEVPIELSVSAVRAQDGWGAIGIIRDITERKRAAQTLQQTHEALQTAHNDLISTQMQLVQAAKLESVGRLAAGVAHEVKNPLAIIMQGLYFVAHADASRSEDVAAVIKDMDHAVRRADAVIHGLLDFASTRAVCVGPENINAVLEQALLLVQHELTKSRVTLAKDLAADLPVLQLDRQKIEQVIINLAVNACHAMPGGGQLTVKTRAQRATRPGTGVGRRQTDRIKLGDPVVVVEIADSGAGIPEAILDKVFDPFFTTKPPQHGTGLGLAVVRSIVELHGGIITLTNRPEGGALATVMLPIGGAPAAREAPAAG